MRVSLSTVFNPNNNFYFINNNLMPIKSSVVPSNRCLSQKYLFIFFFSSRAFRDYRRNDNLLSLRLSLIVSVFSVLSNRRFNTAADVHYQKACSRFQWIREHNRSHKSLPITLVQLMIARSIISPLSRCPHRPYQCFGPTTSFDYEFSTTVGRVVRVRSTRCLGPFALFHSQQSLRLPDGFAISFSVRFSLLRVLPVFRPSSASKSASP